MKIKDWFLTKLFVKKENKEKQQGFGTFFGVYLPGVLSMFGVIIYLRFGWIIGSLGLSQVIPVVLLSCFIILITVLSIASAATNKEVGGGGTYYIVSRSLGIEIGSAIGVPLFIAQALAISFCTAGFAESIQPFFPNIPITYLGSVTLLVLLGIVNWSASIALKTQLLIFLIIIASLVSLFLGKKIPVEETSQIFDPGLTTSFWAGFALFFPATTGVESGVSMSGNLRSPRKSLPLGTLAVLATGLVVYLSIPFFLWDYAPRNLLVSDPLIFQHIARFPSLITLGIWAATLSSILSGLLAAPRTLQALALDGVFPKFFAKEMGKYKEPRNATLLCFAIAMIGVFFGSIDKIAPVLTMFYLIAYAMLNLVTGLEELLDNPSWRPTFRIPWVVSISGVALCLLAMFMIDAGATFLALLFVVALYIFMRKRGFVKQWEDIQHGLLVFLSRFAIYKLGSGRLSPRAWRPNFLVLSENPMQVSRLTNFTAAITGGKGFLTLASVFSPNIIDHNRAERWKKMVQAHLKEKKIEALVEFCMDENLLSGAKQLLLNYGMGSLSPNTLVLGEMRNWQTSKEYLGIIQTACAAKKNVIIVGDKQIALKSVKEIHVWWDDVSRPNSELMLLLSHMLTSNKAYKKSQIHLNSIISNEMGKAQRLKYFQEFFTEGRFEVTPNIYPKEEGCSSWEVMAEVSKGADVVLIGMNPPKSGESTTELEEYYNNLIRGTRNIPNVIFVICSEALDSEIFL